MTVGYYVMTAVVQQLLRLGTPPVADRPSRAKR
jgi:hypothetical protein